MKVLMLSKACIVGAYQKKLEEMAAIPGVALTVVVPPSWNDPASPTLLEQAHLNGYEMIVTNILFNGQYHFHFYPQLWQIVRRVRPDIMHIDEEPYNLATFQAMWLAKRFRARTVVFSWQNLLKRYPPPFNWMERYVLGHTDALLVGNREAETVWRHKGYQGLIDRIPQFGVDPNIYYRHERAIRRGRMSVFKYRTAKRPTQPTLAIGYIGRLVPEKGIEILLRAISQVVGPWTLNILGDGPDRERLEKMAYWLGIGPRVEFDPKLPSTRLPNYLSGLDVLVLPSITQSNWKEQFGRVLIEAMACGVIVVGSHSGAIPEVIGEAGLTFAENDIEALQDQLQRLTDDVALRDELRQRGRQRVIDHYTQAAVARNTVTVYREILNSQRRTAAISNQKIAL